MILEHLKKKKYVNILGIWFAPEVYINLSVIQQSTHYY
jgi:hypothetical protein